jgi:CheY-like chemotaxis protein
MSRLQRLLAFIVVLAAAAILVPVLGGQEVVQPDKKGESKKDALKKVMEKAQEEYRIFFKEPKTAVEFWAALSFEISVGKFDVAAYHLDKLLKLNPKEADEGLLEIEDAEGMNAFLQLRIIKEWSKQPDLNKEAKKNVEVLIDRVMAAVKAKLSDQERIAKYLEGIFDKVPEVREFSINQVLRSRGYAAPLVIEKLRASQPKEQERVKKLLLLFDNDIMPPLLELYRARDPKDAQDIEFRLNLLWLAKMRNERRVMPYLWSLSSAPQYPAEVREKAKELLAYFQGVQPDKLPPAKLALVDLAERYYQNKVRWPDTVEVSDRDDPKKLVVMPAYKLWYLTEAGKVSVEPTVLRPDVARFGFGQRYAREALELDRSYLPAQVIFLLFQLEIDFHRKPYDGQLDKLLTEPRPPALQRLLAKIDLELLETVLERAMRERNLPAILPLIDALGERGEVRTAMPSSTGAPGVLVRALYYPDRRVQYAAARAMLRLPATPTPVASTRIVEVLTRFLQTQPEPRVLFVHVKDERANELRTVAKEAGYAADAAPDVKTALEYLHRSADYDAVVLDSSVPEGELPFVLNQLRNDSACSFLPLLLITAPEKKADAKRTAERNRNVFVLPAAYAAKGPELKRELEDAIKFAAAPDSVQKAPEDAQQWLRYEVRRDKGQMLSAAERGKFAKDALDWFAQMARGELAGYDLKPAKDALLTALNNKDTATQALYVLSRFPGQDIQQRLAAMLFDPKRAELHVTMARELNRHIQKNGMHLTQDQVDRLRELEASTDTPPALRVELAVVMGTLRATPQQTGSGLLRYSGDEPKK